jgi:hypothetical protein
MSKKKGFCTPTRKWNQEAIGEWNEETFGSDNTGIIGHFKEEVKEFDEALDTPEEPEEAADMVILLMVRAHRKGYDLLGEVYKKMEINRKRKWLKPDKDGIVRHA